MTSVDSCGDETVVSFAGRMLRLDSVSDVLCIVEAVEGCERMVTLCLEGNTLGVEAAKELAKSLESQPFVENVLFNNLFTGRLKSEIPEVLLYMTSGLMLSSAKLDTLDLSDNAIGPVGMPSLLPFLESHSCETLKTLRLNNCGLGVGGGQILAKGLVRLKSLKTLVCGRNRLEILGSQAIGNALTELKTLETLEMPQNGIHSTGIEAICRALDANKGLKNVNLNDNNLKSESKAIASALRNLKSIESINLGDCLLKSAGSIAICEAIQHVIQTSGTTRIKEIVLSGNEITGQKAIEALITCSQMLAQSNESDVKLRLELNDNNFGETGVETLLDALTQQIDLNISNDEGSDVEEEDEDKDSNEEVANTSLKTHNSDTLIEELSKKIENESTDINELCSHFVQISVDGFDSQTARLRDEALVESEVYLKSAIRSDPNEFIAMNALLIYLGLLKDETGVYKTVDDLRGPLSALTHSLGHLSGQQKQVLRAFMNRPNKSVEMCGKIKHNLMQQLFI